MKKNKLDVVGFLSDVCWVAGCCLIAIGVYQICAAAGLIAGGCLLSFTGYLLNLGRCEK